MRQASTCGRVLAPGQTPIATKQWKSSWTIQPWFHIGLAKKQYMSRHILQPSTIFGTLIAQVEYQDLTLSTRILDSKPSIDAFYRIGHRWKLKYFHFAHFLLNIHQAVHWP